MRFLKFKIDSTLLSFLVGIFFVLFLNFALFREVSTIFSKLEGVSTLFVVSIFFVFTAAFNIMFTLFSIKYIEKPLFIILILSSAAVNFAMYTYKTVFDVDMLTNIFQTNVAEAGSYMNLHLAGWLFATGLIPASIVGLAEIEHRPLLKDVLRKLISIGISLLVIGFVAVFYYKDYASIARNNNHLRKMIVPYYYVSSTIKYVHRTYFYTKPPYTKVGDDAKLIPHKDKNRLAIVVVGETARTMNYELNGYMRATNEFTKKIPNLVSFKNVTSCGTATAVSVPCMFSMLGKSNYSQEAFDNRDNVTDVLKYAGVEQLWWDNDSGCKGVCHNIANINVDTSMKPYCDGGVCTDDIFLKDLQANISKMKGKDGVIYIHVMGSHGPTYYLRTPKAFKKFAPLCERSDIQNCSDAEVANSYDDSIRFTDYVISKIIEGLKNNEKDFNSSLIYMSDHGESLGENGVYLHGLPYAVAPIHQTHVPFLLWMNDGLISSNKIDYACVKKEAESGKFSHDNLTHSLLGLMKVETKAYDGKLDIFKTCVNGK